MVRAAHPAGNCLKRQTKDFAPVTDHTYAIETKVTNAGNARNTDDCQWK
jgi:hypothetical protein